MNNNLTLAIERREKQVRLIVFEGDEEYVCRKERFSAIAKFLEKSSAHIFRGRLQLVKNNDSIQVLVKGKIAGNIPADTFRKALSPLQTAAL